MLSGGELSCMSMQGTSFSTPLDNHTTIFNLYPYCGCSNLLLSFGCSNLQIRKYLIHDSVPGTDVLLAKAEYQGTAAQQKVHQQGSKQGATVRMLHELALAKSDLADLSSYPLDLPALNTLSFSTVAVLGTIVILLCSVCCFCLHRYCSWKRSCGVPTTTIA